MTVYEIIAIIFAGTLALAVLLLVFNRLVEGPVRGSEPDPPDQSIHEAVTRLRADVRELRRSVRSSGFADMADAITRLKRSSTNYDEATLVVPLIDLALGKVINLNLLNGKEVAFRLPSRTKSGTKFRFRKGGENGRDLHLIVRATNPKTNGEP